MAGSWRQRASAMSARRLRGWCVIAANGAGCRFVPRVWMSIRNGVEMVEKRNGRCRMTTAIIMLALVTVAALLAIGILLLALDAARDNEREALRQLAEERAKMDTIRDTMNAMADEERGIRSEAAKKGHQTRKRRLVVERAMQQDADVQTMIGGAQ